MQTLISTVPAGTTVDLAAGTYDFTEIKNGDGYGLEINNAITLRGAGDDTVILGGNAAGGLAGQAYVYITADGVTISNLKFEGTHKVDDLVKVSSRNYVPAVDTVDNVTFESVTFTGTAKNYLNLHGTRNARVSNCKIGTEKLSGFGMPLSIAASKGVTVENSTIVGNLISRSVNLTFKDTDENGYPFGSEVTFSGCDIAGSVVVDLFESEKNDWNVAGLDGWTGKASGNNYIYSKA